MITDEFGFLFHEISFVSDKCVIQPLKEYKKQKQRIEKYVNRENFVEPPLSQLAPPEGKIIKKSNLKTIAWMYRIPMSHCIKLDIGSRTMEEARSCESGFFMGLLGYLYGCRLQFKGWFMDGFVPLSGTHNIRVAPNRLNDFLMNALLRCSQWEEKKIQDFNKILFMHTRSPGYKWDWERFMVEYAVFDSIWRLDFGRHGRKEPPHSNRIKILCEKYGLFKSDILFKELVDLRNNLFHEVKWDEGLPCTANGTKGFMHAFSLRRLNQRFICALLGFKTDYIKTNWTSIGQFNI